MEFNKEKDVRRIKKVLAKNGIKADEKTCRRYWKNYSHSFFAQWECLPDTDAELWKVLKKYLEERYI